MRHLLDMTPEELTAAMQSLGQLAYRATQVLRWVWKDGVYDFAEMSNLPSALREELRRRFAILSGRLVERRDTSDGVTKLLIEWPDGECVETVLIPSKGRASACLSTQVGCPVGCAFCASGADGFVRNLTGGEIIEQILHLQRETKRRVTNAVFMGMGEPLANYDATVFAVRALIDADRLGISARHVTVSTVGLPKQIRRLAREDLPITLAISLHAPNDALRRELIPAARGASIEAILSAAEAFYQARKREVTLEYVLLSGLNDTNVCAEALARIARRLRCNVNLILYNPIPLLAYEKPTQGAARVFAARLRRRGINATIRRSRGLESDAACGQLRRRAAR